MHIGIDLGTTNSAVAITDGENLRVVKNKDQMDTTPSAVLVGRNGRVMAGKRAFEARHSQPGNVATGFKRVMGQSDTFRFDGVDATWTPEALSAEVLKSLVDDVRRVAGEAVRDAVVTVPADFTQLQCEATSRAATLAGIGRAVLVQEPIAASLAYTLRAETHGKRWLVYDFGGGTFDAALVSTEGGRLAVLDHAGDNMCGGKDIDDEIVKRLLWPRLTADFDLPRLDAPKALRLKRSLYKAAEEAKIELSSADTAVATVLDAGDDLDGDPVEAEHEITRAQLDAIVVPFVDRTVDLCIALLDRAGVAAADVAGVLLVGGPTYMPALRARLAERLGIPLRFDVDPMTVVAQGAALYAAQTLQAAPTSDAVIDDAVAVTLAYPPTCGDAAAPVLGRIDDPRVAAVQIEAATGMWGSGWVTFAKASVTGGTFAKASVTGGNGVAGDAAGTFEIDVPLVAGRTNAFTLSVRTADGVVLVCSPATFSIRHGLAVDAPPLPHSLGAEVVLGDKSRAVDVLFPRGTPLPAARSVVYKAARKLDKDTRDDRLAFKVWEGEDADPDANVWVGALNVHAADIRHTIPQGAEVQIDVTLDESRRMQVHVFVPCIDQHFEGRVYVPAENQESAVSQAREAAAMGANVHARIGVLREKARRAGDHALLDRLRVLEDRLDDLTVQFGDVRDPDDAKRAVHRMRALRGELSALERSAQETHGFTLAVSEARAALEMLDGVLKRSQREPTARRNELARTLEAAVAAQDAREVEVMHVAIGDYWWSLVQGQGWYWADRFDGLAMPGVPYTNPARAKELIAEGEALVGGDGMALKPIVQALWRLRPVEAAADAGNVRDSGLRR